MIKIKATLSNVLMLTMSVVTLALASAHAGDSSAPDAASLAVPPVDNPCPRLAAGSALHNPPALVSRHGVLMARFSYQTTTDEDGRTLFCFMTPDGAENPTLRVHPGDNLIIKVTNNTPAAPVKCTSTRPIAEPP